MQIIIIIIIGVIVYIIYGIATNKEMERQRKQDPKNNESLTEYNFKKSLFSLFKNYLYENADYIKQISNDSEIKNLIESDFPNYGKGISGWGIMNDFSKYGIIIKNNNGNYRLGETFKIISIAYENFEKFVEQLIYSGTNIRYTKGGYNSNYGDKIKSKIFYIELQDSKFYLGLSSGYEITNDFKQRHNLKIDKDEMYLFCELQLRVNSENKYPYFDINLLRTDISIKEYLDYLNNNLEICKNYIN